MVSVGRLCLAVLFRSKRGRKCVYLVSMLLILVVFFHLGTRDPALKAATWPPIADVESPTPPNMAEPKKNLFWTDSHQAAVANDQRLITVDRNGQEIGDDIPDGGDNRAADADSSEIQNIRNGRARIHRFLFVFRHYEQLGRATINLISLASLAKYKARQVVAPFVNNSRMTGLQGGLSHNRRGKNNNFRFGTLDEYFDVAKVNDQLELHGYSRLADFKDFEIHCKRELNIVVHFLYDPSRNSAIEDMVSWYKLNFTAIKEIYRKTRESGGWNECPVLKRSKAAELMGFRVGQYVCVDPEVISSAHDLEENVFNGAKCVGIVQWKGTGEGRTHFPLFHSITRPLAPSALSFNHKLVELAKKFVGERLGDNFIAVHIRTERHFVWRGVDVTLRCVQKLAKRVRDSQTMHKIPTLFLASDLADHGSDTLVSDSKSSDRARVVRAIHESLNFPIIFNPQEKGIYDKGAAAIVEMNILAAATRLFTLGGGNFQEWLVDLFVQQNQMRKTRVHRMCEISY